jgi:hypothetical protein
MARTMMAKPHAAPVLAGVMTSGFFNGLDDAQEEAQAA